MFLDHIWFLDKYVSQMEGYFENHFYSFLEERMLFLLT